MTLARYHQNLKIALRTEQMFSMNDPAIIVYINPSIIHFKKKTITDRKQ